MYLGRIVTKNKNFTPIDIILKTDKYSVGNDNIPTLIIGKKNAEEIFGAENIRVLNKKICDNTFWEFAKTERRNDFERGVKDFYKYIFDEIRKNVKYYFFNIFLERYDRIKDFIRYMYSNVNKTIVVINKHIYIYSSQSVIGLSIEQLNYIGIDTNKIISRISLNPCNKIVDYEKLLSNDTKKLISDDKFLIPYICQALNL